MGQCSPTRYLIIVALWGLFLSTSVKAAVAGPEDSRALDLYESAYVNSTHDRMPRAFSELQRYPLLNKNSGALTLYSEMLVNNERLPEAEAAASKAIALDPKNARAYGLRGYCYLRKHNRQAAIADLKKAVGFWQVSPFEVTPIIGNYKNLRKVYQELGENVEAAKITKLIGPVEAVQKAEYYRENRNIDEAVSILSQVLKAQPKLTYALLLRAVMYNNLSKFDLVIKDLNALLVECPRLTTAYYLLGDAYFERGEFEKAKEAWLKSLAIEQPNMKNVVAYSYVSMTGRFRQNFVMDDDVLVHRSDVFVLCGLACARAGKWQESLKYFDQSLALRPDDADALLKRAQSLLKLGRQKQALADLNKAAELDPEAVDPLLARSKIYESMNDMSNAMLDLDRVVKAQPTEFGSYILRGELRIKLKMYDKAVEDFSKAIEISPSEDDAFVARAEAYEKLGRYEQAASDYRKAIQLNPRDKAAISEKLERMRSYAGKRK